MTIFSRTIVLLFLLSLVILPLKAVAVETVDAQENSVEIAASLEDLRAGRPEKALKSLHFIAESGNPIAFYHIGEIYRSGSLGTVNIPMAKKYYSLAASSEHIRSALTLANLNFFSESPKPGEIRDAVAIWQKYALLGEAEALHMLGMLLWNGEAGLPMDPVLGYGLVWQAANAGFLQSVEPEVQMSRQLSFEDRQRGRREAKEFNNHGFKRQSITLGAIFKGLADPEFENSDRPEPPDWNFVWRIDMGSPASTENQLEFKNRIMTEHGHLLKGFKSIFKRISGDELAHLHFGPFLSMKEASVRCTLLRHYGQECFVEGPDF